MKIERTHQNGNDTYQFQIDNLVVLEIGKTAISTLAIELPSSGNLNEYYDAVEKQFDIEKLMADLLNKSKANKVVIDSEVCRADGEIIFQTEDLKKYIK